MISHDNGTSSADEWDGRNRRMVDGLTLQMMAEVRTVMEKHEHSEKQEFERIDDRLVRLERQIESLQQSVTRYMEKTPDKVVERIEALMDEAFPEDPEFPDATAGEKRKLHRRYHAKLIQTALRNIERKDGIVDKVLQHVAQNAITLISIALLAYFGIVHK